MADETCFQKFVKLQHPRKPSFFPLLGSSTLGCVFFLLSVFLVLGIPARGYGECFEDGDCPADSYCKKADGDCEGVGICEGKAEVCLAFLDPVCGCDGITYSNSCEAALKGVSLMHEGACQGNQQVSVLGTIYDKWSPWKDTVYLHLKECSGLSGAVENLENKWVKILVGPLLVEVPGSDFVLTKTGYYLYYHPGKMAGEEIIKLCLVPVSENVSLYCGNVSLDGILNPIVAGVSIGEWTCGVTKDWEELPYSNGIKYRTR